MACRLLPSGCLLRLCNHHRRWSGHPPAEDRPVPARAGLLPVAGGHDRHRHGCAAVPDWFDHCARQQLGPWRHRPCRRAHDVGVAVAAAAASRAGVGQAERVARHVPLHVHARSTGHQQPPPPREGLELRHRLRGPRCHRQRPLHRPRSLHQGPGLVHGLDLGDACRGLALGPVRLLCRLFAGVALHPLFRRPLRIPRADGGAERPCAEGAGLQAVRLHPLLRGRRDPPSTAPHGC
mmetsp:Transcript_57025/g.169654  ORF Transcript_57025/g.169654 Transcript_57025/m.169654 type:complete len:236 (-) Transcript_57025:92-799(-)